jgi:hypothetical protein
MQNVLANPSQPGDRNGNRAGSDCRCCTGQGIKQLNLIIVLGGISNELIRRRNRRKRYLSGPKYWSAPVSDITMNPEILLEAIFQVQASVAGLLVCSVNSTARTQPTKECWPRQSVRSAISNQTAGAVYHPEKP